LRNSNPPISEQREVKLAPEEEMIKIEQFLTQSQINLDQSSSSFYSSAKTSQNRCVGQGLTNNTANGLDLSKYTAHDELKSVSALTTESKLILE
jgi:hypothetical protein